MNSRYRLLAFILVLCSGIPSFGATPWAEPAREFGARIASLTGPGTSSLAIKNSSSIPDNQITGIRRAIEAQLLSSGVKLRESEVTSEVRITLSENARGLIWIAEVKQGADTRVALLEVPRSSGKSSSASAPAITLRKALLVSQTAPILDALVMQGPRLAILDESAIEVYDQVEGKWHLTQSFPIVRAAPFPRDVRGRLLAAGDHAFEAYLPGIVCSSDAKASAVDCHASDDPWPLGAQAAFFNSARNFFTGLTRPGFAKPVPPFYSAAAFPRDKYTLWVFAGTDNQTRTWDGVNLRNMGQATRDWGSDLVAVRSGCGVGSQLLVTGAGDDMTHDTVRAYEIVDREPSIVAAPLSVDGPITALWPTADEASAVAIVHNTQQRTYDAYSVSISCSQ